MAGHRFIKTAKTSRRLQRILVCLLVILTVTMFTSYHAYFPRRRNVSVRLLTNDVQNISKATDAEREISNVTTTLRQNECHVVHKKLNSCNKLPNYFLYDDQRHHFQNAIINFWHIQKASGSTVGHCLINIYKHLQLPKTSQGGSSCKRKAEILQNADYYKSTESRPVLRGHGSLGLCDFIKEKITDRKCSAFTIFRDPYDRLVSHYFFNRQVAKRKAAQNKLDLALNKTIKEWIKGSGSVVWKAFSNEWKFVKKQDGKEKCEDLQHLQTLEEKWPPINRHLTDIASNLDKHLSFIGLTEDLKTTYRMLEAVYGLPFVEICSDMHVLQGSYETVNATEQRALKLAAKRELMEDPEIQRLIQFEVLMYEKAKEIFEVQKKIFLKMKESER